MPYDVVLTIHIVSFIWNIGFVVLSDAIGLLWVLGKIPLPKRTLVVFHRCIWVGLATSIATGLLMFAELREYLLTVTAFYSKMLFVLALVINSFLISNHLHQALRAETFATLPRGEKRSFFISGAVSTVSWVAVVISATMLGL